jgi:hypothetical protein
MRSASARTRFRALCPDAVDAFTAWWAGERQEFGAASTLIVLDPTTGDRQRPFAGLDQALAVRPRHRGYPDAAAKLGARAT